MTEELKKALEAAVTDEQKKAVAEKFKDEISKLSEEELDKVAGGWWGCDPPKMSKMISSPLEWN